ncbi:threonine aldolase family protein [Chitinimonas sp. BJB300]|uniref:threonine aldolase family protein n=1 Tax=Chitinimonas sp. BJB300 TaxID=1559339 RepID=UPI000C0F10C0|nr:beta-eliminating lyase-related protein [Chitinimonas sp. BJB300]PHV13245.1 threonine aldolase [Chitinimonas sp. BJB300]TSJ89637.1 threonine aldolase [Chitinimonas sp. BJB300]
MPTPSFLQPALIRQQCHINYNGFTALSLADEFRAMADWCAQHDLKRDSYGSGALIADFETKIATLLGKPAGLFLPSGIMAQLIAVQLWSDRTGVRRIGMHPLSHLLLVEEEAYQALLQLHGVPIGSRLRPLLASDLDTCTQPLACLIAELPVRYAGGQLPSWDELETLKAAAHARKIPLHMDGARLWESQPFYGRSHAEICAGFDSVYVSMYKGIGGIAGAVLVGETDFIEQARLWRRRFGGTLSQQSPMIASAAMHFDTRLEQLPACYRRTVALAEGLAGIEGLRINPAVPQTNMCHLYFDAPAEAVMQARDQIAASDRHWIIDMVQPAVVPGWSSTELTVGNSLLGLGNHEVVPRFARLLELARANTPA